MISLNKVQQYIPKELRPYLSLADTEDKIIFTSHTAPSNSSVSESYDYLTKLKNENPKSQLITFLAIKWSFILGKGKEIIKYTYEPNSWSYLIYLRLQSRFSPSPELLEISKNLEFNAAPVLIQIETAMAKAEVFLRLSAYKLLDDLYNDCLKKWGQESSRGVKSGLTLIQAYYGFRFYFLGIINESLDILESAFNSAQTLKYRELISVIGNFYAAVNQSSRKLRNL